MSKKDSSKKRKNEDTIGSTVPCVKLKNFDIESEEEYMIGPALPPNLIKDTLKNDEDMDNLCHSNSNIIGPTMPSAKELAHALKSYQGVTYNDEEDEDDDEDVIGPALPTSRRVVNNQLHVTHQTPLGGQIILPSSARSSMENSTNMLVAKGSSGGREEWMLTPGESKASQSLSDTFGVSRGFQTGKVAKQKAKELEAVRAEQPRDAEEDARTQAILDEYREMRGPSLMDQHLKKKKDCGPSQKDSRRPFDRERDVLQRKPMDASAARELVEQAKGLDSRFSAGNIQRNFL